MGITIKQIAEIAGVSRGTVDRALNNRGRIKPEVKERICNIAKEIGYIPPKKRKKCISTNQNVNIGVIIQLSKSEFVEEIKNGINDAIKILSLKGINFIVKEVSSINEYEQKKCIDELLKENVSAIALMPVESDLIRSTINNIVNIYKIPIITFNSDIIGTKRTCFVGLDNRKSGYTSAGLMGMLTGGEGKVLIITGFFSNNVNSQRVDGFIEELKKSFPNIELVGVHSSFDDYEEVESIIFNSISTFPDLKGIFVVSSGQYGIKKVFQNLSIKKRPFIIIYDITLKNRNLLQYGFVDFLIDQELYLQGYKTLFIISDIVINNIYPKSEYIYTNINIKTKYNI